MIILKTSITWKLYLLIKPNLALRDLGSTHLQSNCINPQFYINSKCINGDYFFSEP